MANSDASLHLYRRAVDVDGDDSLSVIAQLIGPAQTLLDLGMGTGALGQYLRQWHSIVADGVTLNQEEADIAQAWYRHAVVADLDHASLGSIFGTQRYDCIVCADVLEHLKAPQNLLTQCKTMLNPGGRLITSVPNAGYCGLVAELMQGDFRYRAEGLLDNSHLRFFTRKSLQRFFGEHGWAVQSARTIQRNLLVSEFRVAFDELPPAVARHLLAVPDALTYQYIFVLQPAESVLQRSGGTLAAAGASDLHSEPASALFSAQLYLAVEGQYDEAIKLVTPGRIGEPRQTLVFNIPASTKAYTRIRLDPADRPGFFRLHHMRIRLPDGGLIWQWQSGEEPLAALANAAHNHILFASQWEMSDGALLLLHGDDPWVELALEPGVLQKITQSGARLEVCAGWPMSADYLQSSAVINTLQLAYQQSTASLGEEVQRISQRCAQLEGSRLELQTQINSLNDGAGEAQKEIGQLTAALGAAEQTRLDLQAQLGNLSESARRAQHDRQQLQRQLLGAQGERDVVAERLRQASGQLQSIERSTLFRVTRPLVHAKMRLDHLLGRSPGSGPRQNSNSPVAPVPVTRYPVDIIVPVFRGLDDTRCCLESVISAPGRTAWRLIVINDCSPELELSQWLRAFSVRDPRIVLLENTENLGFVGSVNRGMAMSQENDVLLLNSDTEVANDWLDRMQRAAYSQPRVASVTPFSNNATICSYPRFCKANELPMGYDTASLDRLFSQHLAGQTLEIPTGVGFCLYIRRECLQQTGLFDAETFGKGYGEENDFCVRAQKAGWSSLHALDTFVRHAGGISFGASKSEREQQAMETLRRLHPNYESDVHAFVQSDPARQARFKIDLARITAGGRPVILGVMHNREGGTLRHVQELAHQLGHQAIFLRLAPAPGGAELRLEGPSEAFALHFKLPEEHAGLLQTLRQLQVGHIHYHHLLDHRPDICELPAQLGVSHDFTVHDYHSYCPQISLTDHNDRYCGEEGLAQCRQCLQRHPAPAGETIDSWRDRHARLLTQARYLITPSFDAAQRMHRFVPAARIQVLPHASLYPEPGPYPAPHPRVLHGNQRLKIVVLGALSRIKGADTLEEVATLTAIQNAEIEFHLIGYPYRSLRSLPNDLLTVHGGYQEEALPQLLQSLQADLVWFPALWPETYSYTLSAALEAGLPVVAPDLGAFAERLQNRDWTWTCGWYQSASQWLEFFKQIRHENFCKGTGPEHIPLCASPALQGIGADSAPLVYRSNYLGSIPPARPASSRELLQLQSYVDLKMQSVQNSQPSAAIKLATLRALMRLHASPGFSNLRRMVPMHLQRRVKSWLGK
ncbi:MAG: methyltransferase domain-containing protein [Rhodoferax sp.]